MRKLFEVSIVVLAIIGLVINVILDTFIEPYSLARGLMLFKYFTMQSNLIVAMYFMLRVLGKTDERVELHNFIGGVTIYIFITFSIFAIMLQGTYHPTGWAQVSNILLHYLVPILVIVYTFTDRKNYDLYNDDVLIWIIFPVVYIIFMLVHGNITGDYLYPFFQVENVGRDGLIFTIFILVGLFYILSFLFMKIVSLKQKSKTH